MTIADKALPLVSASADLLFQPPREKETGNSNINCHMSLVLCHETKTQSKLIFIFFFHRAPEHKTYQETRNTVGAESNCKF